MKHLLVSLLLAGTFLTEACSTPRQANNTALACNEGRAGDVRLVLQPVAAPEAGSALPVRSTAFVATGEAAFFSAARTQPATFSLQLPSGCKTFSLQPSGAMDPVLAAKYPALLSLKGHDGNTDLRLDWNGNDFRIQIIELGKTWFVEPYFTGADKRYLLFSKEDAPGTKKPFERRAVASPTQDNKNLNTAPAE